MRVRRSGKWRWCSWRGLKRGWKLTGQSMTWKPVMSCLVLLWGLSGCMGSIYKARPGVEGWPSRLLELSASPELAGSVPVGEVLERARAAGVLASAPYHLIRDLDRKVPISPKHNWGEVIKTVEYVWQLSYDPKTRALFKPAATHGVDNPDEAGRLGSDEPLSLAAREMLRVAYRFGRVGGSLNVGGQSETGFDASGNYIDMGGSVPAGVRRPFENVSRQRVFQRVTNTESGRNTNTEIVTLEAGVILDSLVGSLPGGLFRVNTTLTVSAFTGGGDLPSSTEVVVPIEGDYPRGEWHLVTTFRAISGGVRASLEDIGLRLQAGGETIGVWVRVD